jgi:cytochrome c oxidase subunit I
VEGDTVGATRWQTQPSTATGTTTRGFFTRWFMSTNHKDIGILYLFTGGFVGLISVAFTVYMRMELMEPGVQYMCMEGRAAHAAATADCTPNGHLWNVLITAHGILMMFFVVIPALFGGFGNYFMPLQIGAPDMAFPRMNNLSYWLYVAGTSLAVASLCRPGGNGQLGRAWAGCSIRRCRRAKAAIRWTSRSSRCTCRVPRRSWARST